MNPMEGNVLLPAGDKSYTLKFSTRAFKIAEHTLGRPLAKIMAELMPDAFSIETAAGLLFAGLQAHHPDVTADEADTIMDAAGIATAMEKIGEALTLAMPAPDGAKNPQRRTAGIGKGS